MAYIAGENNDMSGIDAQRGFIYQTIIAMIECLENKEWDAIKLEPSTKRDKVDIQLYRGGHIIKAIQVKSSKNSFSKPMVEKWLKEIKADSVYANKILLCLVGDSFSAECDVYIKQNCNEIKKAPFNNLEDLCTGKLAVYIKNAGLAGDVRISDLNLIDDSLFSRIHRNSIASNPLSRDEFEEAFRSALPVYVTPADKEEKRLVTEYYGYIQKRFCEKPDEWEARLFGDESVSSSYIDPYYMEGSVRNILIEGVEKWCSLREYGVMLLHGEPGHGKTSFCRKCVHEFISGNRFKGQKNVFVFSLNPARSGLLADSYMKIENVFTWGMGNPILPISICHNSVIFLDGFDEFIDEARRKGLADSIVDFMDRCFDFSKEHNTKMIITSRSMCVREELHDIEIRYTVYKFEPLTQKQQEEWILSRKGYEDYLDTFLKINTSETMKDITGIPILFRMIVTMRFSQEIDNRAALYKELFYLTLRRQKYNERVIKERYEKYEDLSYRIFSDNEDTTEIDAEEVEEAWTYSYYVKAAGKRRLGFLHRSFYENFLSSFILRRLIRSQSDEERKAFIEMLSVRKLTTEYASTLQSVLLMIKKESKSEIDGLIKTFQDLLNYITANELQIVRTILDSRELTYKRFIDLLECAFFNINVINYCINVNQMVIKKKTCKEYIRNPISFDIDFMGRMFGFLNMKGVLLCGDYSTLKAENIHLEESVISSVLFEKTNMQSVHFDSSSIVISEFRNSLMRGSFWEKTKITGCAFTETDLSFSTLKNATFQKTTFEKVVLTHSDLSDMIIVKSKFLNTDFSYTNLKGVTIRESNFTPSCKFDYAVIPKCLRSVLEEQKLNLDKVIWTE